MRVFKLETGRIRKRKLPNPGVCPSNTSPGARIFKVAVRGGTSGVVRSLAKVLGLGRAIGVVCRRIVDGN